MEFKEVPVHEMTDEEFDKFIQTYPQVVDMFKHIFDDFEKCLDERKWKDAMFLTLEIQHRSDILLSALLAAMVKDMGKEEFINLLNDLTSRAIATTLADILGLGGKN